MSQMSDSLASMFSPDALRSGALDIAQYIIILVIVALVGIFAWFWWQDKKIYIYPVRIFRRRENGQVKEQNTFGGYVIKNKISYFMVKIGKYKKRPMATLPDSRFMDTDNRIYYWQLSPDAQLVQTKREFVIEKVFAKNPYFVEPSEDKKGEMFKKLYESYTEDENFKTLDDLSKNSFVREQLESLLEEERNKEVDITVPTYSPVPSDLKQQAMAEINNYRNLLGVDINKQMAYFVGGLVILGIVAVILFYIAMNKGAVPILTEIAPILLLGKFKKKKS